MSTVRQTRRKGTAVNKRSDIREIDGLQYRLYRTYITYNLARDVGEELKSGKRIIPGRSGRVVYPGGVKYRIIVNRSLPGYELWVHFHSKKPVRAGQRRIR